MTEKKVLIRNLAVNYKIAGSGPAILVLHGWGGSSGSWVKIQKLLALVGYSVIVPDLPGFGKSKTPALPWGIGEYSDFFSDFAEKLKLKKFHLLGHSFGGRIAIRLAAEKPQKMESLILCDSAGIKPEPGLKTRIIFWLAQIGNAVFSAKPLLRFKDSARNIFYVFLRKHDYAKANGTMKETIKKVLNENLLSELPRIKAKTLIIWGQKDRLVPVRYAHIFKEKVKNSEIVILPHIGHSPNLEAPEKLAAILISFLRKHF